jgi:glycosyltransferase involved in cell wall biosynthesis
MAEEAVPADHPPVSVVITTLGKRPELLARAVRHVFDQDYAGHVQCIVVFDRPEVGEVGVEPPANRELVVVTNSHHQGLPGGRNCGVEIAKGELLGFCDDDDYWRLDKLRLQVDLLNAQPDVGAVACGARVEGPGIERDRYLERERVTLEDVIADRVMEVHPGSLLVPRATWAAVGGLDEHIPGGYAEDYEWVLRLAAYKPIGIVPDPLYVIEWHGQSYYFARWPMIIEALRYLMAQHPELARSRPGLARIHGQIAFALASSRKRGEAIRELRTVIRLNPREKRIVATLPVLLGVVSGERLLAMAQKRGRGI